MKVKIFFRTLLRIIGATCLYAAAFGSVTPYCNCTTSNLLATALYLALSNAPTSQYSEIVRWVGCQHKSAAVDYTSIIDWWIVSFAICSSSACCRHLVCKGKKQECLTCTWFPAGKLSFYFQALLPVNGVMKGEIQTLLEEPFGTIVVIICCC